MSLPVVLGFVLLCALWGTTWAAIRVGLDTLPPFVFAFERAFAVAAILAVAAVALHRPFPAGRALVATVVAGVINVGISWALIFWGEQYVPSGLTSVFGSSAPVWTALLAQFFVPDDPLTRRKAAALALGLGGTVLLVGALGESPAGPVALATILLALLPMAWAVAAVLTRLELRHVSAIPATAVQAAAGAVILAPLALREGIATQRWDASGALAFGYLVVFGSCVGLVLFTWLLQRLRPTTVLLMQVIVPAEAVFIGAAFLAEPLTPRLLLGAALVAAAVLLNALAGRPSRQSLPIAAPAPVDTE